MTPEQRKQLSAIAHQLGALWCSLPDGEHPDDAYRYHGGVVELTFKGGFTEGWVDMSWNEIIADVYAGEKFSCAAKPYEKVLEETAAAMGRLTSAEQRVRDDFFARAGKLVRDKLPQAGMDCTAGSNALKNYLLKQSGKTGLKQLDAVTWERLLSALENATPKEAVEMIGEQQ